MNNANAAAPADLTHLDLSASRARWLGHFDAAVAFEGLAQALRSGQLTSKQLHTSNERCRLFGGRALSL